jgi:hypothetical protein
VSARLSPQPIQKGCSPQPQAEQNGSGQQPPCHTDQGSQAAQDPVFFQEAKGGDENPIAGRVLVPGTGMIMEIPSSRSRCPARLGRAVWCRAASNGGGQFFQCAATTGSQPAPTLKMLPFNRGLQHPFRQPRSGSPCQHLCGQQQDDHAKGSGIAGSRQRQSRREREHRQNKPKLRSPASFRMSSMRINPSGEGSGCSGLSGRRENRASS